MTNISNYSIGNTISERADMLSSPTLHLILQNYLARQLMGPSMAGHFAGFSVNSTCRRHSTLSTLVQDSDALVLLRPTMDLNELQASNWRSNYTRPRWQTDRKSV